MSTQDLLETLSDTQDALNRSKFAHSITNLEDPSSLKRSRQDIARLKTELHSRTLQQIRAAITDGTCNLTTIDTFLKGHKLATVIKRSKVKTSIKNLGIIS